MPRRNSRAEQKLLVILFEGGKKARKSARRKNPDTDMINTIVE